MPPITTLTANPTQGSIPWGAKEVTRPWRGRGKARGAPSERNELCGGPPLPLWIRERTMRGGLRVYILFFSRCPSLLLFCLFLSVSLSLPLSPHAHTHTLTQIHSQRQKEIDKGKNTVGYANMMALIPRQQRTVRRLHAAASAV